MTGSKFIFAPYVLPRSVNAGFALHYEMPLLKLGITASAYVERASEARSLKRGVARCGFDIDITAYADIDIKSLSPGSVLRTPLDPSGQGALSRAPNPTR